MFFFSRLLVEFLAPLNVSLVFLLLTLFLILTNKTRVATATLTIGILVLVLCGYGLGFNAHLAAQEGKYPALTNERIWKIQNEGIEYIVVLGSGHVSDQRLPQTSQIGGASLYRLVEGIRIHRLLPKSRLVICGGVTHDPIPNATVVGAVATQIGIAAESIIIEDKPQDTVEEAREVKKIVGSSPFVLVTSALHMDRAKRIFKSEHMVPIPAPTDYIFKQSLRAAPSNILPYAGNLVTAQKVIY